MERIDKQYAIIYVDRTGESLKNFDNRSDGGFDSEMITDYYNVGEKGNGFKQWNFYLIIAAEHVPADMVETIQDNDVYARKIILRESEIDAFIENRFPDLRDERGTLTIAKGKDWKDAKRLAAEVGGLSTKSYLLKRELEEALDGSFRRRNKKTFKGSWYRDHSLMYALTEMDKLRAQLIRDPDMDVIFFSHISNETNIAEKKFKLFKKEEPAVVAGS